MKFESLIRRLSYPVAILAGLHSASAHALEADVSNALQTVGGIYCGIYIHEMGHALSYKAFGATDISIQVPTKGKLLGGLTTATFPANEFTQREALITSAAGLVTASLAGEIVIQNKSLHTSPLAQSILGAALVSNMRHVYVYYTEIVGKNGYMGNDLDNFEAIGGNPHLLSAGLVAYTAWSLHRMSKDGIPLFYINLVF
jgi:hypothetical protein